MKTKPPIKSILRELIPEEITDNWKYVVLLVLSFLLFGLINTIYL